MLNVGLTGGIASGKSTVARMFEELGAFHIDLDRLAHECQEPEGPVWRALVGRFGREILDGDGRIDRRRLGEIVFADRKRLAELNALVHPAVLAAWERRLGEIRERRPDAVVLSDIPLLFEAGLGQRVDLTLLVYVPPEEQIRRLMARDGFGRPEALRRLAAQIPIDEKLSAADIVIRNDGTLDQTRRRVEEAWEELSKRALQPPRGAA